MVGIEVLFPNLSKTDYRIASPQSGDYNCIAWAANEDDRWWEPDPYGRFYWPSDVPREITIEAFIQAFENLGYVPCQDDQIETDFQKVAIYTDPEGIPTHAARQLRSGMWTSKIGKLEDIEHTLEGLEDSDYGKVAQILKRPI